MILGCIVQKVVGDRMSGALIETEARTILNQGIRQEIKQGIKQGKSQGISETKTQKASKLLKRGKLTVEEIAEEGDLLSKGNTFPKGVFEIQGGDFAV